MPNIATFLTPKPIERATLMQVVTRILTINAICIELVASSTCYLRGPIATGSFIKQKEIVAVVPVTSPSYPMATKPMIAMSMRIAWPMMSAVPRRRRRRRGRALASSPLRAG